MFSFTVSKIPLLIFSLLCCCVTNYIKTCGLDFSGGSDTKESACDAGDTGDMGSIPGSGKSPGRGNGNPLQYSCLENLKDRGAWRATVHGVANESDTTEQLTVATRD